MHGNSCLNALSCILAQAQAQRTLLSHPFIRVAHPSSLARALVFIRVMPISPALNDLIVAENLVKADAFIAWCDHQNLSNITRFAMRASNEEAVEKAYVEACNTYKTGTIETAGDVGAIKWIWKQCRNIMDKSDGTDVIDDTKPMGTTKDTALQSKWFARHHFHFTARHLLNLNLTNKLYKCATCQPPQFCIILPDDIKLRASITRKEASTVTTEPGKPITVGSASLDPCTSHTVFFKRIVAMFNTWAYVCIEAPLPTGTGSPPLWFCYQDVRNFVDHFEELFFRRFKGQRPPLEYMFKAYLKMMNIILDQVNTFGLSLGAVLKDRASWEPVWHEWDPPAPRDNQGGGGSKSRAAADIEGGTPTTLQLDDSIEKHMLKYHRMTKSLLNQHNQQNANFVKKQFLKGNANNHYNGGKGKGKGSWKGGGKTWKGGKGGGKGSKGGKSQKKWDNRPPVQWKNRGQDKKGGW